LEFPLHRLLDYQLSANASFARVAILFSRSRQIDALCASGLSPTAAFPLVAKPPTPPVRQNVVSHFMTARGTTTLSVMSVGQACGLPPARGGTPPHRLWRPKIRHHVTTADHKFCSSTFIVSRPQHCSPTLLLIQTTRTPTRHH
jgi:hypothetical protein